MHKARRRQWHCNLHQRILLEYAQLKRECPPGIYLTLKPGDPAQWSCVLFVRKGPYAPAVLRFQAQFPLNYPESPPTVAFASEMFHPLVTPLTTYTYSAGTSSTDTVSATDEGRLPPGGFRLRDGFPTWFERSDKTTTPWTAASRNLSAPHKDHVSHPREALDAPSLAVCSSSTPEAKRPVTPFPPRNHGMWDVLSYIKQAFEDEKALDDLPLECAGNPGAWKAWRAYRVENARDSKHSLGCARKSGSDNTQRSPARQPDEWSWDGVWQERVQNGISASLSDQVLYGSSTNDDPIQFAEPTDELVQTTRLQAFSSTLWP